MADQRDDIEKYLKGELTPAEMHALEKRALSDPFLAEALEGASTLSSLEFGEDLSTLRRKLSGKGTRVVPIWVWTARVAAGIAVVFLVAYFVMTNRESAEKDRLALNKDDKAAESPRSAAPDSAPVSSEKALVPTPPEETKVENGDESVKDLPSDGDLLPSAQKPEAPVVSESHAYKADNDAATRIPQEFEENIVLADPAVADSVSIDKVSPSLAMRDAGVSVEQKSGLPTQFITGRVLDAEDGKGLPGVNVTIKGSTIGTITDEEGHYRISVDSINEALLFSFIGYENKEVTSGPDNSLNVTLNPDISQLSEVVVVGYGGTKRDDTDFNPILELAEPAGGRKAYKSYLQQNLQYPEQALNNKVEGKVTVQFTLESNGKMTDFKVLKGLGYGCDDEVIRLIKQGPKWNPSRRNTEPVTDRVKVRLRFALPKK